LSAIYGKRDAATRHVRILLSDLSEHSLESDMRSLVHSEHDLAHSETTAPSNRSTFQMLGSPECEVLDLQKHEWACLHIWTWRWSEKLKEKCNGLLICLV